MLNKYKFITIVEGVFCKIVNLNVVSGGIHGWGTTFGTKDLRTMSHWISAFIMIYYYLINKF